MPKKPTQQEIDALIEQAKPHELGIDFLINGSLGSVAMTFGVHAFVVDAARDELAKPAVMVEHKKTVRV